jgi:hypothetical protein
LLRHDHSSCKKLVKLTDKQIENLVFRARASARKELEKEGVYGENRA